MVEHGLRVDPRRVYDSPRTGDRPAHESGQFDAALPEVRVRARATECVEPAAQLIHDDSGWTIAVDHGEQSCVLVPRQDRDRPAVVLLQTRAHRATRVVATTPQRESSNHGIGFHDQRDDRVE